MKYAKKNIEDKSCKKPQKLDKEDFEPFDLGSDLEDVECSEQ